MNAPVKFLSRFERLIETMRLRWKSDAAKRSVAEGYRALRAHPHLLADIAMNNHVLAAPPEDADAVALARHQGRRDAALEIIRLSKTDLATLLSVQR